jgi:hypothetical protein
MKPKLYVKKPVAQECVQWTGHNLEDIRKWTSPQEAFTYGPGPGTQDDILMINTLRGQVQCKVGDWIIKNALVTEFYPCPDEVFKVAYQDLD